MEKFGFASRLLGMSMAALVWATVLPQGVITAGAAQAAEALSPFDTPATAAAREKMVQEQIIARKIEDPRVVAAMRSVIRHMYVPDDRKAEAYEDYPLAIGFGQTISLPYIVAYMSQLANIQESDKVLEVGSGSGYHGSVMSKLAKEVYSIEIVPGLAERSQKVAADMGMSNLTIKQGDGYFGWPEKGPFDAIVVTAAAEHVPPPLIQQLAEGGVMIIPVGHPFVTQMLVMVQKTNGKITSKELMPVKFVPLTGNRPQ